MVCLLKNKALIIVILFAFMDLDLSFRGAIVTVYTRDFSPNYSV